MGVDGKKTENNSLGMGENEKEFQEKEPQTRFEVYCEKLGINPNLLMLKVTLFMMYGANSSLIPFLTIHMQSIGLTVEQIAIVYLALPLTTFLSPPITGFLVDKLGHYKTVVIFSLVLNGIFHHALVLIPQMEIPGKVPIAYVLRHPSSGKVEVWWSPCPSRECPEEEELNLVLDDCLDHCPLKNISNQQPTLLSGVHQSIAVRPPTFIVHGNGVGCGGKGESVIEKPTFGVVPDNDLRFHLGKKNRTSISRKKDSKHRSKTNGTLHLSHSVHEVNFSATASPTETPRRLDNNSLATETPRLSALFVIDMHPDLGDPKEHLGMELEEDENETVTDFRQHFDKDLLLQAGINYTDLEESDLRCGGFVMATNLTYNTLKELAADCMLQVCSFEEGGPEVCPPDYKESEEYVFWTYFFLRFLGTAMLSASVTVMDPIALTMVQQYGGEFGRERLFSTIGMAIFSPITGLVIDYSSRKLAMLSASVTVMDPIALTMVQQYGGEFGRERLFSTIGMAIFSPITGLVIDYSSRKLGYTDYSWAFYAYSFLLGISAFSVLLMPIGVKMPADNIMRDMWKLLKMPHIFMVIFFLYVLGNCWGFLESYLFLYLKELGASNYLLGVTVSVGTLSSIPFLYGAENITKKIGHVNVIIIAFFSHALRLTGYSFIDIIAKQAKVLVHIAGVDCCSNAWWCFPFEALESLSVHLMWVAAATYCAVIAPRSLLATLIGILGMTHFSLGRGSGSFFGGLLISTVGTRQAFRVMGLTAVVGGGIYGILHFFWLHKYTETSKTDDKEPESEKLNPEDPQEKGERDALSESTERLSLMIRFNHRGSLTSLTGTRRGSITEEDVSNTKSSNPTCINITIDATNKMSDRDIINKIVESIFDASNVVGSSIILKNSVNSVAFTTCKRGSGSRRNSSNELGKALLKSAFEAHFKNSNPQLNFRTSTPQLSKPKSMDGTPQQGRRGTATLIAANDQPRRGSIKEEDENEASDKDVMEATPKLPKKQSSRLST